MSSNSFKFCLILALGAVSLSVWAQPTNNLSSPTDDMKDKSDFLKDDSQPQLNPGNYAAPRQFFNNYSPTLPPPQPLFLGNQDAATRDALNRRKNWALLTPEQIFNVQSPEDILGIKKPDAGKNLSLEEQYLLRESRPVGNARTNGSPGAASWRDSANPFDKSQSDQPLFSRGVFNQPDNNQLQPDSTPYYKQFLNGKTDNSLFNKESKQATAWSSVFSQPTPPKPTPEQMADMERFRAMMQPASPADNKTPTVKTSFSSTPLPESDSIFQPLPLFNPVGRSVTLIKDDISRPVGIKPLSGVTGPEQFAPTTRPAWQAQLPPWLTDGPQAHDANRNF